jgi:hypothetical protein
MVYDPGYLLMDRVIRIESTVYSLTTEKLVWSALSETTDPNSSQKIIDDVVRLVIQRMRRMGIVS